jgi:hypothetical protein
VWKEYEELAQHFNDLLMRLRSQSLAAVATFATAASVLLKADAIGTDVRWDTLAVVFGSLAVFWLAIWLLDFFYYNRLLLGAVDALEEIERESEKGENRVFKINLSTLIEEAVVKGPKRTASARTKKNSLKRSKGLVLFYGLVMLLLVGMISLALYEGHVARSTTVELAGIVSSVNPGNVMLTEGKVTRTITLAQTTEINVNQQKATAAELKPGMTVKVVLNPDPAATRIDATGK